MDVKDHSTATNTIIPITIVCNHHHHACSCSTFLILGTLLAFLTTFSLFSKPMLVLSFSGRVSLSTSAMYKIHRSVYGDLECILCCLHPLLQQGSQFAFFRSIPRVMRKIHLFQGVFIQIEH